MKLSRKKNWFLLTLLFISFSALAQRPQEQEVQDAEYAWLQAYEQNDTLAMQQYVATGFLIRYPDGSVDTKEDLMQLVRRNAGKPSSHKFYTEQTTAHVWDSTVILRGIVVTEFMVEGVKRQQKQYYTDTWLKTEGGWQVIASHLSEVPENNSTKKGKAVKLKKKRKE